MGVDEEYYETGNVTVSVKMCLLQFVNFSTRQIEFGTDGALIFKNDYVHFGKNSVIYGKMCVIQTASTGDNCCAQRSVIPDSEVRLR